MENRKLDTVFHVHTFRCGHAEKVPDECYVIRALEMNAGDIWFTDHAPFPGNPFGNRMKIEQLPEYLETLTTLKEKYAERIRVHIGLEIEFFEGYAEYYRVGCDAHWVSELAGQEAGRQEAARGTLEWMKKW